MGENMIRVNPYHPTKLNFQNLKLDNDLVVGVKRDIMKNKVDQKMYSQLVHEIALEIYRHYNQVTVEDVRAVMDQYGIERIRTYWYNFFRRKTNNWMKLGTVMSSRPEAHKCYITVWGRL